MKDNDNSNGDSLVQESEDTKSYSWSQIQWLRDLRQQHQESTARWKTTLFQTQAVFLSLCLPLTLGQVPEGETRNLLLVSSLFSALSLPAGLASLWRESEKARRLAESNEDIANPQRTLVRFVARPTLWEQMLDGWFVLFSGLSYWQIYKLLFVLCFPDLPFVKWIF